jgi:hypothetical protein
MWIIRGPYTLAFSADRGLSIINHRSRYCKLFALNYKSFRQEKKPSFCLCGLLIIRHHRFLQTEDSQVPWPFLQTGGYRLSIIRHHRFLQTEDSQVPWPFLQTGGYQLSIIRHHRFLQTEDSQVPTTFSHNFTPHSDIFHLYLGLFPAGRGFSSTNVFPKISPNTLIISTSTSAFPAGR